MCKLFIGKRVAGIFVHPPLRGVRIIDFLADTKIADAIFVNSVGQWSCGVGTIEAL